MARFQLKLYITDRTTRSERAIASLRRMCEEKLGSDYELIIIDVLEQPQAAEADKIRVTPTVIKFAPPPIRRVVGDLSDIERVLEGLGLNSDAAPSNRPEGGRLA